MSELDQEFWDRYMRVVYDKGVATTHPYKQLQGELIEALDLKPGVRVIDAGCGTGNLILRMLEAEPELGETVGVELNAVALEVARAKIDDERVSFREFNLCHRFLSNVVPGALDRVVSMNVLYAVPYPSEFFRNVRGSTLTGGLFVCTNAYRPAIAMIPGAHELWLALEATDEERAADEDHRPFRQEAIQMNMRIARAGAAKKLHFWSPEKLAGALEVSGFEVLEMRDDAYAGINTFFVARAI